MHRLQVQVVPNRKPDNSTSDYVVVYDQGITSAYSTKNQWAWVLNGGEQGNLNSLGLVDLPEGSFSILFDMFPINGGILVTGKNLTWTDPIKLGFCNLVNSQSKVTFNCSSKILNSVYNTTYGYVGIMNTGQYVEVDTNPNNTVDNLYICDINGDFSSGSLIRPEDCKTYLSYKTYDNVSISNVEGNQWMVVVKYCHFDSTYAGYSLHQFELRYEDNRYDDSLAPHLVPLGRTLVNVTKTNMSLFRQVAPYVYAEGENLIDGTNLIRVDCTDDDSPTLPVSNIITANKMINMKDMVMANSTVIPDFNVYEDDYFMFQLDPHAVIGNDLRVTVDFDTNSSQYAKAFVYDTENVNVDFRFIRANSNITQIHFSGNIAVVHNARNEIVFLTCRFIKLSSIQCIESAVADSRTSNGVFLKKDVNSLFSWTFAWSHDKDGDQTQVYIFDKKTNQTETLTFNGLADDAIMTQFEGNGYLALSYSTQNRIRGFIFPDQFEIRTRRALPDITLKLTHLEYFCPTDIDFDPEDTDVLEVLSICPGKDQRIIRFLYPP